MRMIIIVAPLNLRFVSLFKYSSTRNGTAVVEGTYACGPLTGGILAGRTRMPPSVRYVLMIE